MGCWQRIFVIALALALLGAGPLRLVATPAERSPEAIARSCSLVPLFVDGEPIAYEVTSIEQGALLHRIGLRRGDRILGANGRSIGPDFLAGHLLQLIARAPRIALELESDGPAPRVIVVEFETPQETRSPQRIPAA